MPSTPSGIVGRAAHKALEYFYSGTSKELSIEKGFAYLKNVPDFEVNFGKATSRRAQAQKRKSMGEGVPPGYWILSYACTSTPCSGG